MSKLLISACLLGDRLRYDGSARTLRRRRLERLLRQDRVIGFCPEVGGGLPVPRPPAEIQGGDGAAASTAARGNTTAFTRARRCGKILRLITAWNRRQA